MQHNGSSVRNHQRKMKDKDIYLYPLPVSLCPGFSYLISVTVVVIIFHPPHSFVSLPVSPFLSLFLVALVWQNTQILKVEMNGWWWEGKCVCCSCSGSLKQSLYYVKTTLSLTRKQGSWSGRALGDVQKKKRSTMIGSSETFSAELLAWLKMDACKRLPEVLLVFFSENGGNGLPAASQIN